MKQIIFVLMFALSLGFITSCNIFGDKKVVTDPCSEKSGQITSLQAEVTNLQVQIGDLKAENAKLQADLECCEGKLPAAKRTTTTVKRVTTPPTVTKPAATTSVIPDASKNVAPPTAPTSTKYTSDAVGGKANLDYLRQDGDIIFCAQANNREDCYFPHYAMQHGVTFSKAPEDNEIKGYNWRVEPTEFYDGDYGVTVDGTFYVADNLIQQSLKAGNLVFEAPLRIKCPYTSWMAKEMSLQDGYWIYKTQRR
jgi:regulator of replication initiation timing